MNEEPKKADAMSWEDHLKAGMDGLKQEMKESFESRETLNSMRKHGRAAMREALMAWRSLLDGAIKKMDESNTDEPPRVTKIEVE